MFFHRAIGRVTFPLIAIAFVALSIQTTWQFLLDALPHENLLYHVLGLAVFELGAFCWFSLLTAGAENVLRTIIALVMTMICVGGVATAAIYEVGSQMIDLGFHMDPAFLQWTPVCVLAGFVSTLVATLCYMAASPHVAHRFAHLNATGQEPPIGSYMRALPPTYVSPDSQLSGPAQPRALPAPKNAAPQVQPTGIRARMGNLFSRLGLGLQNGNVAYNINPADEQADDAGEVAEDEPAKRSDGAQENRQTGGLDFIGQRMLALFNESSPSQQNKLLEMAYTRSTEEVVNYLHSRYPDYARHITPDRVRAVMAAYMAQAKNAQAADDAAAQHVQGVMSALAGNPAPEPQMQQSAPPRQASARARSVSTNKSKVAGRRNPDELVRVLEMLDKAQPGQSAAQLARMANCDDSTVRRWRANRGGK